MEELGIVSLSVGQDQFAKAIEDLSDPEAREAHGALMWITHQIFTKQAVLGGPAVGTAEAVGQSIEKYVDRLDQLSPSELEANYEQARRSVVDSSKSTNVRHGAQALMVMILGEMIRREAVAANEHRMSGYERAHQMLERLERSLSTRGDISALDDGFVLNAWLTHQSKKMSKAWTFFQTGKATEKSPRGAGRSSPRLRKKADEGVIFETVHGYENIVFNAQELLAAAYAILGRYDDALFLHRYVAQTVQDLVRSRPRNQKELKDIRDHDINHFTATVAFLVKFSQHMATQGDTISARQLLNEAIRLSDTWDLATKRPELGRFIDEQRDKLNR